MIHFVLGQSQGHQGGWSGEDHVCLRARVRLSEREGAGGEVRARGGR